MIFSLDVGMSVLISPKVLFLKPGILVFTGLADVFQEVLPGCCLLLCLLLLDRFGLGSRGSILAFQSLPASCVFACAMASFEDNRTSRFVDCTTLGAHFFAVAVRVVMLR